MNTTTSQAPQATTADAHSSFVSAAVASIERLITVCESTHGPLDKALESLLALLDDPYVNASEAATEAISALFDAVCEVRNDLEIDGKAALEAVRGIPAPTVESQAAGIAARITSRPTAAPPCPGCGGSFPLQGGTGLCGRCSAANKHRPMKPAKSAPQPAATPAPGVGECFMCQKRGPLKATHDGYPGFCASCAARHDGTPDPAPAIERVIVKAGDSERVYELPKQPDPAAPVVVIPPEVEPEPAPKLSEDGKIAVIARVLDRLNEPEKAPEPAAKPAPEKAPEPAPEVAKGERVPQRLILLSCTKEKLDGKQSAADLYMASDTFRARRAYAEREARETGAVWAVISAKHGILWQREQVKPYDMQIRDLKKAEKQELAMRIGTKIAAFFGFENLTIEAHMGKEYRAVLNMAIGDTEASVVVPRVVDSKGKPSMKAPHVRKWAEVEGVSWALAKPAPGELWPSKGEPEATPEPEAEPEICFDCGCAPCACDEAGEDVTIEPVNKVYARRGDAIDAVIAWTGERPSFPRGGGVSKCGKWDLTKVKKGEWTVEPTLREERETSEVDAEARAQAEDQRVEAMHKADVSALKGTAKTRYETIQEAFRTLGHIAPGNFLPGVPGMKRVPPTWRGFDSYTTARTALITALDMLVPKGRGSASDAFVAGSTITLAYMACAMCNETGFDIVCELLKPLVPGAAGYFDSLVVD